MLRIGAALRARRTAARRSSQDGQSLVEFSLVVPLFLTLLMATVEFAFAFNAILATNYASRDAALLAAEGGSHLGSDCSILRAVEKDMGAPADQRQIQRVEIYRSTQTGDQIGDATRYVRSGSMSCNLPDGRPVTLPYTLTANGYPMDSRCNMLAGCRGGRTLDHVGVRVAYRHLWRTPFGFGISSSLEIVKSSSMRMEAVL